jgi:hypothetical protein
VFFDALGVEWEYEVEGFDLGDDGKYLPDFWLPQHGVWVEIKPAYPSETEMRKAERLSQLEYPVVLFYGIPSDEQDNTHPANGMVWAHDIKDSSAGAYFYDRVMWFIDDATDLPCLYLNDGLDRVITTAKWDTLPRNCCCYSEETGLVGSIWHPRLHAAIIAARSARFGKNGRG